MRSAVLGIAREQRFSPGAHAAADAAILALTQDALVQAGYATRLITPERLPKEPVARVVFAMCQSPEALAILQHWEGQGVYVCNAPAAVLACYRHALLRLLNQAALPCPPSTVISLGTEGKIIVTEDDVPPSASGWWVKRGDVHAMQADDVRFVRDHKDITSQLLQLRQRNVPAAIVQAHVTGQEIKFYALRGHGLLHYQARGDAFWRLPDPAPLRQLVVQAGNALGLEVYGGDCVVTSRGDLVLLDVNDWPSFRPCQAQAAIRIAEYLLAQGYDRGLL